MEGYNFKEVEEKWKKKWKEQKGFKAIDFSPKPKYYVLTEFFGVSGKGIHMGHVKANVPTDVIARYKRLKGFNVLYPVGWDAFGLPTENYAIKTGEQPEKVTEVNIENFTKQLESLGMSYDWDRQFSTSDPKYYKWTQWIFLQLLKHGLAYKKRGVVNFCPNCKTTLSNEDSQNGECDRCHGKVEQRERDVWYLKMTDYADKMLQDHEHCDFPEYVKAMQRNWIGKSEGAEVDFAISNTDKKLKIYTTRPDTLFGVTFMGIAPEHPLLNELQDKILNINEIKEYQEQVKNKTSFDRLVGKDKTGVKIEGVYAINPINNKQIPIFIADYVMMGYGTGALMAVPAHDGRDYEFAKKFNIPIIEVIKGGDIEKEPFVGDGELINSDFLNGQNVEQAKQTMIKYLEQKGIGTKKTNFKMQDWPFNRQRYWGEPFPVVICKHCGYVPLPESELPLKLPKIEDYKPDDNGDSPLAKAKDWVNCKCPKCGKDARRETDTMPNWAGSSWYWLRFLDPHNDKEFVSQDKLKYWGAVDLYTGGDEHVTRHMLYASFWHHFLYDIGAVPFEYPFKKRLCNGLVLGADGNKMSKSLGNVVDPMDILTPYGADAFRLYTMFSGEYDQNSIWNEQGIKGCVKFINNVWELPKLMTNEDKISEKHEVLLNRLIKKIEDSIENFTHNTAISDMMIFVNTIKQDGFITKEELKEFLIILNPFAPFITSEMFEKVFKDDILQQQFPTYNKDKLLENEIEIPVQVNGKVKGTIKIALNEEQNSVIEKAKNLLNLKETLKEIYVPNKIINLIVKK